jgi:hypothetical protein
MRIRTALLLTALAGAAFAQPAQDDALRAPIAVAPMAEALDLDLSHGVRLAYEPVSLNRLPGLSQSAVFTSMYWSRAQQRKAELAEHFGLHWAYGLAVDPVGFEPGQYASRSPLGYPEGAHWSAKPVAGLQFERRDLLFAGDHFSLRSTSDIQTLIREAGMVRSPEEIDMLSLIGWHARSSLVWELGDPNREIQWQFTARLDRRAYSQASTANFSLLRRF